MVICLPVKIHPQEVFALRRKGWTLQRLADRYSCSKAAVWHYLHRTRCRTNQARIPKSCACGCGRLHLRRKFATVECYYKTVMATISMAPYVEWRQGQRIARHVVRATGFDLQPKHVVHHVDRDCRHNAASNLWVFASHGEHMSFHRGGDGTPIWKGYKCAN